MQIKENIFVDEYVKRFGGKKYRDVRFHVKGGTVEVSNLVVSSNQAAYEKALQMIKQATEL